MADAIETLRNATEQELTAIVAKLGPSHRRRVLDALERYGSVRAVPDEVWESIKQDIDREAAVVLLLLMGGVYSAQARKVTRQLTPDQKLLAAPADDEQVQAAAASSAGTAARMVADDYVNGMRARLERNVDDKAPELNQLPPREAARAVRDEVDAAVGPDAAEPSIVTNTTRGVTAAQQSAGDDIGRQANVTMTLVWRTERDSKVCPVCRPLDGKTVDRWEAVLDANTVGAETKAAIVSQLGPPAHIRCRCALEHVVMTTSEN